MVASPTGRSDCYRVTADLQHRRVPPILGRAREKRLSRSRRPAGAACKWLNRSLKKLRETTSHYLLLAWCLLSPVNKGYTSSTVWYITHLYYVNRLHLWDISRSWSGQKVDTFASPFDSLRSTANLSCFSVIQALVNSGVIVITLDCNQG